MRKANLNNLYHNSAYLNAVNSSKGQNKSTNANLVGFYLATIKFVCFWCFIQILIDQI